MCIRDSFNTACVFLMIWLNFFLFITVLFCALLSLPVICYVIEILLAVREREWEGDGNKTWLNLGLGMEMGMNHREWEGMGWKESFPLISSRRTTVDNNDVAS